MSNIAITGGATGTGVFSVVAPSTSTNRTITLPDSTGTMATAEAVAALGYTTPAAVLTQFNATGAAPVYACRAWVNFNGTGTVAIRAAGNVSSITDNGVGFYTVNFATAMPDASYSAVAMIRADTDYAPTVGQPHAYSAQTTSQLILKTGSAFAPEDSSIVTVAIFR